METETITGVTSSEVLEALRQVERRIDGTRHEGGEFWDFGSWATCTCGHIYAVATGEEPYIGDVTNPGRIDGLYQAALVEVARTNGQSVDGGELDYVHTIVSDMTSDASDDHDADVDDPWRAAALELVRRTITVLEARHEAARQRVAEEGS